MIKRLLLPKLWVFTYEASLATEYQPLSYTGKPILLRADPALLRSERLLDFCMDEARTAAAAPAASKAVVFAVAAEPRPEMPATGTLPSLPSKAASFAAYRASDITQSFLNRGNRPDDLIWESGLLGDITKCLTVGYPLSTLFFSHWNIRKLSPISE